MSMKIPRGFDLEDDEWRVPCGTVVLCVAPASDGATFDIRYAGGEMNMGIKVPFTYDSPFALESKSADPFKIIAHGKVHIFYL